MWSFSTGRGVPPRTGVLTGERANDNQTINPQASVKMNVNGRSDRSSELVGLGASAFSAREGRLVEVDQRLRTSAACGVMMKAANGANHQINSSLPAAAIEPTPSSNTSLLLIGKRLWRKRTVDIAQNKPKQIPIPPASDNGRPPPAASQSGLFSRRRA